MKAWEIISDGGVDALVLNDRSTPEPGPGQVLVKIRASSINYRDLSTIEDPVSRKLPYPTIPNSDAAGEITAIGAGVNGINVGDCVASCFLSELAGRRHFSSSDGIGARRCRARCSCTRSPAECQRRCADSTSHLSFAEASTLPCAALTAWHALTEPHPVRPGDKVLLLGTGGVSVFAQQFCKIMGAETIVTSSKQRQAGADESTWRTPCDQLPGNEGLGSGGDRPH